MADRVDVEGQHREHRGSLLLGGCRVDAAEEAPAAHMPRVRRLLEGVGGAGERRVVGVRGRSRDHGGGVQGRRVGDVDGDDLRTEYMSRGRRTCSEDQKGDERPEQSQTCTHRCGLLNTRVAPKP